MRRLRISTQPSSITRSPSLGFSPVVSVSRTICLAPIRYPAVRQLVRPLVLRVAGMAPHPVPLHFVQGRQLVEPPPQVDVLHRFLVGGAPAAALPVVHPFGDPLRHVQGIGIELYPAGALERLEGADRRGELPAVIRGIGLAAIELALGAPRAQQHAPAAGARIAAACPVAEDLHHLSIHGSCESAASSARAPAAARAPCARRGERRACRAPASPRAPNRRRRRTTTSAVPSSP